MTKPLIDDTRWAVTAGGVESTLVSVPDGTLKDDGYSDDEIPLAKDWNYWHRKAHAWFQYLNAAALVGDTSVDGNLTVGGLPLAFTNFTFTVDTATDQLLHVAHGLQTGDGPVRVSSTGTLPSGLVAGIDYWIINDFGDALRLTPSRIDALNNAHQIDIATTGSGTHTLLHQAGTTRVTTTALSGNLTIGGNATIGGQLTVSGNVTVVDQPLTFVDFTYTADNTADTILHAAHGMLTGDGPVRTSNSGGALPGGLAAGTDYYFIRVDASTGKLATSRANALAGVAINLTTDGTGTQTLLHQAGTTRLSDLAVTGQFLHEQTWQHSIAFALPDASASLSLGVSGTTATRLALLSSTGDNVLPLAIPIGTISKWSVTLNKTSAAGTITAKFYECNTASGAGVTQIGATQSNSASNPGQITLGQTGLAFGMTIGHEYFMVVNGGGTTGDMVTSYYVATSGS